MKPEFLPNNSHLRAPEAFAENDTHLMRMMEQTYVFHSSIIDQLPTDIPGIYNLGGGRQVGKTTLLKQWMLYLLSINVAPKAIAFLSCELIVDEHSLYRIVSEQLNEMPKDNMRYLILDEITYVSNWDKAIKYLADTNAFKNVVVVISGSDLVMMQEARKRFPGRRGKANQVDFHYFPLTFKQFLQLKHPKIFGETVHFTEESLTLTYEEFNLYLIHGGFLTAINEYAETNSISNSTLITYSDWIRGDVIKRGKKEYYLRELMHAIIKHYASQISWRNLIASLSIEHIQTAIDYMGLLESMDAIFIQMALIEDKLVGAPKKNRKFMFCDPFIYHAINAWLEPTEMPFEEQIKPTLESSQQVSQLVEAIVATHCRQHYPTYYIKADSEVDVAYINQKKFWPIEVKWRNQLRPSDLKQIMKYKNGQIWAKVHDMSSVNDTPLLPLPWALLGL